MGGASTQIAFEPSKQERDESHELIDVRLRLLGGQEIHHEVFVTTWLGYGTNQARERYVGKTITEYEESRLSAHPISESEELVLDPCLPKDLKLTELPVQPPTSSAHSKKPHTLVGTGSFEQCLHQTAPLLNKDAPCTDLPCLFNGVHVPAIDFSVSHFIGVSEYWYSSEHVFGLGGPYDVVQYERAASEFCSRAWPDIVEEHEQSRRNGTLGGDGEILEDGKVVSTGQWGDDVELSRLQMQCFKAAWIVNVLHEGIGMPRIVDPGGNPTTQGDAVAQKAEDKGLGRPQFQSLDSVGDIAISWTLGKMVLEASKEVPPLSDSTRPIVDPIDDIPNDSHTTIKPIRPPFLDFDAIEDQLSGHLPSSLTRQSLGFSPVAFLFYLFAVTLFISMTYRLRHRIRSTMRRCARRKDRDYIALGYSMEEGHALTSGLSTPSRPSSPTRTIFQFFNPFRRRSASGNRRMPPASVVITSPVSRSGRSSPTHVSPHRSPLFAPADFPSGVPGSPHFYTASLVSNGSVASLTSRSRNSSRMDLTSYAKQALPRTSTAMM
ncbi:hypothetical protein EIP86_010843 [Pleurotus ostreatoroseus]|nr:hypothetical protein EIP86_010843 [Pleurotus ostreatoroseus]